MSLEKRVVIVGGHGTNKDVLDPVRRAVVSGLQKRDRGDFEVLMFGYRQVCESPAEMGEMINAMKGAAVIGQSAAAEVIMRHGRFPAMIDLHCPPSASNGVLDLVSGLARTMRSHRRDYLACVNRRQQALVGTELAHESLTHPIASLKTLGRVSGYDVFEDIRAAEVGERVTIFDYFQDEQISYTEFQIRRSAARHVGASHQMIEGGHQTLLTDPVKALRRSSFIQRLAQLSSP